MQLDKSMLKKLALLLAGGIILFWALQNYNMIGDVVGFVWSIIFPFILGGIIAFLLNLPMRFIETKIFRDKLPRLRRLLSFLITLVLLGLVITLVIFLVVPQLIDTVGVLISNMPTYVKRIQDALKPLEQYVPQMQQFMQQFDWQKVSATLLSWLESGFGSLFSSAVGVATSVVSGTTSFIIGLIFSIYILFDKEHMAAQLDALLKAHINPDKLNKFHDIMSLVNRIFSRFVSGQCLEAVAIGTVYIIALSIGRFEYALLIGVLIGFTSLIPILGAFIGCIFGAFLILISMGFVRALVFVILFLVIQQLDGNFMYPRIVGTTIGLPPMWVLVAVTVGGGLMGIFGMLFFIPLTSVIYVLLRRDTIKRLEAKGIYSPLEEYQNNKPKKPEKKRRKKKE